jgi:hypothetical protein
LECIANSASSAGISLMPTGVVLAEQLVPMPPVQKLLPRLSFLIFCNDLSSVSMTTDDDVGRELTQRHAGRERALAGCISSTTLI